MKKVLDFLKARWPVVACGVLILVVLPLGWFFSSRWNSKIRTERENAAKSDLDKLKVKVSYAIPSLDPSIPAVEQQAEPNAVRTAFFKTHREAVTNQAKEIVGVAEGFNRRDHAPLVEGLFPDARGQTAQLLASDFAEKIVGSEKQPSVYQSLLDSMNAGLPTDPSLLAQDVEEVRTREQEAIAGPAKRQLTQEESDKIARQLLSRRIADYQQRARTLSLYASLDSLPQDRGTGTGVIRTLPKTIPTVTQTFLWQWDYWVISDVLDAMRTANAGPDGKPLTIDRSPVKRIIRLELGPSSAHRAASGEADGYEPMGEENTEPAVPVTGVIEPQYDVSISGRWDGPTNQMYDLRTAKITLIAASSKLPRIFDAIAQTNFMTVTDVSLAEVDVWRDLELGFYYGPDAVVEVTLEIETVWLRSWTVQFMPADVRKALGVIVPEAPAAEAGGEPQPG